MLAPNAVVGHNQLTDVYLIGLAREHGGRLATLDQRIPTGLIEQGAAIVTVIDV